MNGTTKTNGLARWGQFIRERFPPLSHSFMVVAFVSGNLAATAAFADIQRSGFRLGILYPALLLIFFRLRVFDDIKDARSDVSQNPDRPLVRGLISAEEAKYVAGGVAMAEGGLSLLFGGSAVLAWGGVLLFSLLMYREFFVGTWLRPRMELYAVSHTLVSGLMGLYIASAATGRPLWELPDGLWAFLLANWAVFNVFEFARKTYAREEERPDVESYSKRWTPWGAVFLCLANVGVATYVFRRFSGPSFSLLGPLGFLLLTIIPSVLYARTPGIRQARLYRACMQIFIVGYYGLWSMAQLSGGGT